MGPPCPPPAKRVATDPEGAFNVGPLNLDGLYEVLLRLSAKELCRLRTVCRPWRALLSDPQFAAAHAAQNRRPEPLFLGSQWVESSEGEDVLVVDILDGSGRTVKRVRRDDSEAVVSITSDLVCLKTIKGGSFRLLNPATGSVYELPDQLPEELLAPDFKPCDYGEPVHLLGNVASTGELKVLRIFQHRGKGCKHLFEVCTVNRRSPAQWRRKQRSTEHFVWNEWTRVVVGGVVYFMAVDAYIAVLNRRVTEKNLIVSFDLAAEVWGPSFKGPGSLVNDERLNGYRSRSEKQFTLANLNGSLVIVHGPTPYMDLWFLVDSEKALWIKHYSLRIEQYPCLVPSHPLGLLDDEMIVVKCLDLLQIHNARTKTSSDLLKLYCFSGVSMFTGNLLSLDREN